MYVQRCSEVMRYNHLPHNQAIKAKTTTTPIMDDNFLWAFLFCGALRNERIFERKYKKVDGKRYSEI